MNHKLLELTPEDFEPFVKKKRPDKLFYYHFNLNDQAFFDADVVLFREDGKVTIMKDRYGNAAI